MTIAHTGTAVTVNATSTSGSQSITVPTGADLCLVFLGGYAPGADSIFSSGGYSCSLGGATFTHVARSTSTDDNADVAVASLISPPSGSQTFSWSCEPDVGPVFVLVFYTGVDTNTPILDSGGADGDLTNLTVSGLTTATGSMTVIGSTGDTNVSGQTTITQVGPAARGGIVTLSTGEKSAASSVSADYTSSPYGALVAVSLNPGTSGGGDVSPAAMMMGL